jgi:hypothetical protein
MRMSFGGSAIRKDAPAFPARFLFRLLLVGDNVCRGVSVNWHPSRIQATKCCYHCFPDVDAPMLQLHLNNSSHRLCATDVFIQAPTRGCASEAGIAFDLVQHFAHTEPLGRIEAQQGDGRSSDGSQWNNTEAIQTEVLAPLLESRVK